MKIQYLAASLLLLSSCIGFTPNRDVGEVYYNLGKAYMELDRHEDAIKAYSKALDYYADFNVARYNLAMTYALRKEYTKAMDSADMLLKSAPDSLLYRELKAWILYKEDEYDKAIYEYNEIIEIDPLRETSLYNLGILNFAKEEYELAVKQFEVLVSSYPENSEYIFWLGRSYYIQEDYENTVKYLNTISASDLDSQYKLKFLLSLGTAHESLLEFAQAVEIYREGQVLEDSAATAQFYFLEGRIQWNIFEDEDRAYSLFDTAVEKGFSDAEAVTEFADDDETLEPEKLIEYFTEKSLYLTEEDADTETEEN